MVDAPILTDLKCFEAVATDLSAEPRYSEVGKAFKKLIESHRALASKQRWISITEKLPEDYEYVLAVEIKTIKRYGEMMLEDGGCVDLACHVGGKFKYVRGREAPEITHWMSISGPPIRDS